MRIPTGQDVARDLDKNRILTDLHKVQTALSLDDILLQDRKDK